MSADTVDFGTIAQCRRSTRTLELSNVGTASLTLEVPAVEDFEISPTGVLSVAPGEAKALTVSIVGPDEQATLERVLTLANLSVRLTAQTQTENWDSRAVTFGGVSVRGTDQRTFTISEPTTFEALDEAAFSLTQNSNEVVVTFTPTEERAYAATLNLRVENYECPIPTVLRGSGVSSSLEWSPGAVTTTNTVGDTTSLSVDFTNLRTRIVRMTNVHIVKQGSSGHSSLFTAPSAFDIPEATFDSNGQLVAGRATFEFTFTPTQAGALSASLRATPDVAEQPLLVVPVRATTSP